MASIADKMTLASWFKAKTDHIIDFSDEFMWATFLHRGVNDDATLVADTDEKTRDLILADAYYGAAVSSTKSGTQGESDGGSASRSCSRLATQARTAGARAAKFWTLGRLSSTQASK